MTQIKSVIRLKAKMKNILAGAGTQGVYHTEFIADCRTHCFPAARVREILHEWQAKSMVQSFELKLPHSKKPVKVWRATRLILTEHL